MKNPLKKLSGSKRADRRETLEQEAAEKIRQASSQAPPEAISPAWTHPAPEAPDFKAAPSAPPTVQAPAGRRLTVQERLAARQSA